MERPQFFITVLEIMSINLPIGTIESSRLWKKTPKKDLESSKRNVPTNWIANFVYLVTFPLVPPSNQWLQDSSSESESIYWWCFLRWVHSYPTLYLCFGFIYRLRNFSPRATNNVTIVIKLACVIWCWKNFNLTRTGYKKLIRFIIRPKLELCGWNKLLVSVVCFESWKSHLLLLFL